MNIKYWSSLKLITMVRIAKKILYSVGMRTMEDILYDPNKSRQFSEHVSSTVTALSAIYRFPTFVENQICGVVRALDLEFARWLLYHTEIVLDADLNLSTLICWYSHGIINQLETAKILVRNENISIRRRFVLACKYFFEDYARIFWENLSQDDKLYLSGQYCSLACIQFWMNKLWLGDTIDSIRMFQGTTDTKCFTENYLGLRYYFKKLGPEARYLCISYGLAEGVIHHFDLYLCFSEMNSVEVKHLFRRLSASNRLKVMECFLSWPLQSIFVEVIDQFCKLIPHYTLRNIFNFILRKRVENKWYDIDYMQLVKDIWFRCPPSYKDSLKRDRIYKEIVFLNVCKHIYV